MKDLEMNKNPTVGLLAHAGQVDIRITAKADNESTADEMIDEMEAVIRERLGNHIYGIDKQTLQSSFLDLFTRHKADLLIMVNQDDVHIWQTFTTFSNQHTNIHVKTHTFFNSNQMIEALQERIQFEPGEIKAGLIYSHGSSTQTIECIYVSEKHTKGITRHFGGPPSMGPRWAVNIMFDFLRRQFLKDIK